MTKLLIDGDILAYQAIAAVEQDIQVDAFPPIKKYIEERFMTAIDMPGVLVQWGDVDDAVVVMEKTIKGYVDKLEGEPIIFLTGKGNFRNDVLATYKANRIGVRKPAGLSATRQWLRDNYEYHEEPRLEADDLISIFATDDTVTEKRITVSIDKDFKSIPNSLWYNPSNKFPLPISLEEADYEFMKQTLSGDRVDGYYGCPTVGPKTAEKILDKDLTLEENWGRVVEAYEKQDLTEEYALVQARCARLLRFGEYDFGSGEVRLWKEL